MSFKINFVVIITTCLRYQSMADPVDEMKLKYVKYVMECAVEHTVTAAELQAMANQGMPATENSKCMLACAYKKTGMTDEDGKLSAEGMKKIASVAFAEKPDLMEKSEEFTNACLPINEDVISGDKAECERAARIYKCSIEHSPGMTV